MFLIPPQVRAARAGPALIISEVSDTVNTRSGTEPVFTPQLVALDVCFLFFYVAWAVFGREAGKLACRADIKAPAAAAVWL